MALELIASQLLMLLVLAAVGSGPASLLPSPLPAMVRIAVAPALGLALGAAALVSFGYLMPMSTAVWVVLAPLAVGSAVFAAYRTRRSAAPKNRPGALQWALGAALIAAVLGAADAPLIERHSLGPMDYQIADAAYLVEQHYALESNSNKDLGIPVSPKGIRRLPRDNPYFTLTPSQRRDFRDLYEKTYAKIPVGFASLAAAVDSATGWHAVDTQTPFLGTLLLVGALGGFGMALFITGSIWAALLAGLLFVGPLGYDLYIESGEASRSGISLLAPMALVGALILRDGLRPAPVFLLGLLFAGLEATYSLWVPGVAACVLLVAAVAGLLCWRRGELTREAAWRTAAGLVAAGLIAFVLSPAASLRGIEFSRLVGTTDILHYLVVIGIPRYHLPLQVIPGWLTQAREFYSLPPLDMGGLKGLGRGLILPLILIGLALYGGWRFRDRGGLLLLALVPVASLLAYRVSSANDCSYCVQRQLVIVEPVAAVLIPAGLAAIPLARWRFLGRIPNARIVLTAAAVLAGMVVVGLAAQKSVVLARRALDGGYILDRGVRSVTDHVQAGSGPIQIEAGGASGATLELPATYADVEEVSGTRPSVDPNSKNFIAITPFTKGGADAVLGLRPGYRLVLTRVSSVRTPRRRLAVSGAYALDRRARPFDASLVDGVVADLPWRDPHGYAWVEGPLSFDVAADQRRRAFLRLRLEGPSAASVKTAAPGRIERRGPAGVELCAPVPGHGRLRRLRVPLSFHQLPGKPPPEPYGITPVPAMALRLAAVGASARACG